MPVKTRIFPTRAARSETLCGQPGLTLLHPRIGFHVASVHSIFDLSLTRNNFSRTIGQKLSKANCFPTVAADVRRLKYLWESWRASALPLTRATAVGAFKAAMGQANGFNAKTPRRKVAKEKPTVLCLGVFALKRNSELSETPPTTLDSTAPAVCRDGRHTPPKLANVYRGAQLMQQVA
jgi:hypothetical protein